MAHWGLALALLAPVMMTGATPVAALAAEPSAQESVSFEFVVPAATPSEPVSLVNIFNLSGLSPTIIDPSGVAYLSARDRLLVADSEIDEEPTLYTGANLFELTRTAGMVNVGRSPDIPGLEPTGLDYNPANGHVFLSSDDARRIFEMAPGGDGIYGSADDIITSFSTAPFGGFDAEDVAYDVAGGTLFIADGAARRVFRVFPGPNGRFDGIAPTGDDTVSSFDLSAWGITNLEGIGYRASSDTLLVTDASSNDAIYEITKDGFVLRYLSLNFLDYLGAITAADVTIAPASNGSGQLNMYVVDRAVDNGDPADGFPPPLDGRMFELSAQFSNLAPFVDAGPDLTVAQTSGATLNGLVAHDGLPSPSAISSAWTMASGPGFVSFAAPNSADTTATFSQAGTYVLQLQATDSLLSTADTVQVVVLGDIPPCVAGEQSQANFIDLGGLSADALRAIDCMVRFGITAGTGPGTFSPFAPVPRWQMALFLIRTASAIGITLPDGSSQGFTDIGGFDAATQTAINQLVQLGITVGTGPGTYSPSALVSRWQMAIFLTRLVTAAGIPLPSGDPVGFADIASLDQTAQTAINQIYRLGISKGTSATTYSPLDQTLRWQMAIFLTRTLEATPIL
ncbi:MAG TPA: S-layer homology domain-containing protein [Acidimicrobiia bacterium]|nr:S-layer homology domain-containing protein [Acidimicrobiia bacterium]